MPALGSITIPENYQDQLKGPAEVTDRVALHEEPFLIAYKVPGKAQVRTPTHYEGPAYAQHGYPVGRRPNLGFVNVFTHGGKPGQQVVGEATVFIRKMDDGREFIYVDIHPVSGKQPEYRMSVPQFDEQLPSDEAVPCFPTLGDLEGGVVFKSLERR